MTRAEAEAHVRAIERRCLGKPVIPSEIQRDVFDRLAAGESAADLLTASGPLAQVLRDSDSLQRHASVRLTVRGNAREALIDVLRTHEADIGRPCGYDFNETILAGPLDGEEHIYTCPRCGVEGTYRAPVFVVSD